MLKQAQYEWFGILKRPKRRFLSGRLVYALGLSLGTGSGLVDDIYCSAQDDQRSSIILCGTVYVVQAVPRKASPCSRRLTCELRQLPGKIPIAQCRRHLQSQ
jgi:hypothetical protein